MVSNAIRRVRCFHGFLVLLGCTGILSLCGCPFGGGNGGGGGVYDPVIDPRNFGKPIDNPYYPLTPGTTKIFESMTPDGLEHVEIVVTSQTKMILGVPCVVVHDTLKLDGVLREDTTDWFTQDKDGNVWYFGEATQKLDDMGNWSDEGSWEGGVDGAKPGIAFKANPKVGETYRQEYYVGHAEDMADVVSLSESVTVPFGSFDHCVKTRDYTPLTPGSTKDEFKFYCSGVGEVKTIEGDMQELHSDLISVQTNEPCPTDTGTGCAPDSVRVDLYTPTFSNPTSVTNPLLPISALDSVVYTGTVGGKPFRTETTLLPETTIVDVEGQMIETRVIQYMAFSDGRIEEIAIDLYAQDDLGGVWYLGEQVADYDETGTIYTHEGTWQAGVDGAPLTMNMPPVPHVGDAWRAENAAPAAWEQITVTSIGVTLNGPSGPVAGCVVSDELKLDNTGEQKIFAPGYGELSTGSLASDNLEVLALAIPKDSLSGPLPTELNTLATRTSDLFDAAEAADWSGASAALDAVKGSWTTYRAAAVPPLIEAEMDRILVLLTTGVDAHNAREARHQAIDLTRFIYDLRLRYQPLTEINRVRFDLWLAQVLVDAAGAPGPVKGDTATLELVWNRIKHTFGASTAAQIESGLAQLRTAADAENAEQAATMATQLRASFAGIGWN